MTLFGNKRLYQIKLGPNLMTDVLEEREIWIQKQRRPCEDRWRYWGGALTRVNASSH